MSVTWVLPLQKLFKCRLVAFVGVVCGRTSNQKFLEFSKSKLVVHLGVGWVYPFVQKIV